MTTCKETGPQGETCSLDEGHDGLHFDMAMRPPGEPRSESAKAVIVAEATWWTGRRIETFKER